MSLDYWLGVATPFAIALALAAIFVVWVIAGVELSARGFFAEARPTDPAEHSWRGIRTTRGRWGVYLCRWVDLLDEEERERSNYLSVGRLGGRFGFIVGRSSRRPR